MTPSSPGLNPKRALVRYPSIWKIECQKTMFPPATTGAIENVAVLWVGAPDPVLARTVMVMTSGSNTFFASAVQMSFGMSHAELVV